MTGGAFLLIVALSVIAFIGLKSVFPRKHDS